MRTAHHLPDRWNRVVGEEDEDVLLEVDALQDVPAVLRFDDIADFPVAKFPCRATERGGQAVVKSVNAAERAA